MSTLTEKQSARRPSTGLIKAVYWGSTGLFALMMAFSAYMYLTAPQMAQAFTHLGFPPYFRVELAIAKFLGVVALLAPVSARLKEWAYVGFGITLISAFIAHTATDGASTAIMPVLFLGVLAVSYYTYTVRTQEK
ncbi:MAG: DoxX family protein [Armatimonas sp.]